MSTLEITRHAQARMAQRGINESDIDLMMLLATEVDDGLVIRKRDCESAVRELKRLSLRIERLAGKRLVYVDGRLITAYCASPTKSKRLLRRSH